MRKNQSVFIVSLIVLCLLLAVMSTSTGAANAQPQEDIKSQNSLKQKNNSSVSLSNYDASGNFRYLSSPNDGAALDIALNFIRSHSQELHVTINDLADLTVADQYTSQHNGVTHIYLQQQYQGVSVYNGFVNINIASDGSVINVGNRLVANLAAKANTTTPAISAETAVQRAAQHLGLNITEPLTIQELVGGTAQTVIFSEGNISLNAIPVSLVYQPTEANDIKLAWDIEIYELDADNYWSMRLDAITGNVLNQHNFVVHEDFLAQAQAAGHNVNQAPASAPSLSIESNAPDSYIVYRLPVESPHHVAPLPPADGRAIAVDPANSASPFGWHDTDGSPGHESQFTIGNNVDAYEDTNDSNSPTGGNAARADGGATLDFNHPIDLTMAPSAYIPAAVTNLFYWNNIIHDVFHGYGFDEPSGNFQENNYGNGGLGSDYVQAEAQDGGGNCNANFSTPSDGSNPRMQMYTCTNTSPARDGDLDNGVIIHEYGHGISNRLTGGPGQSGCLSNDEQMGEGWSDWAGLLMTQEVGDMGTDSRGFATWLFGQGPNDDGIRPTPYSTNRAINSTTYGDIGGLVIPHGVGYAWATMLWDMNWALIANHGFNADIYGDWTTGGNNLTMQLVTDGMKLQPCNPGFVDGRDAILAADMILTGGANQCAIWGAFANRGLGYSANQGSSNSTTDGTEAFDTPPACPFDLTISKTASPNPVIAGEQLFYFISVTNNGVGTAYNVVVSDTLPIEVTYETSTDSCIQGPLGTLTCSKASLEPGETWSFSIVTNVNHDVVSGNSRTISIVNTATVDSDQIDTNPEDNSATAVTFVTSEADLQVTKECKPDVPVPTGGNAHCKIWVRNWGPSTARNITAVDNHFSNGTFTLGPISHPSCSMTPNPQINTGQVTCNISSLDPGQVLTITIGVGANEPQDVNDHVTVSSDTPDPDKTNNQAFDGLTFVAAADLSLTKTAAPNPVVAGTQLTYFLQISNLGPATASNVIVEDFLPAGVTIDSVSATGGASCNAGVPGDASQPTTCAFASLTPAATEDMTIIVTVLADTTGILHNDAEVSSDVLDPNNANNLASTDTIITGDADLAVSIIDSPDPVIAGGQLNYDVTITNNGPSTALDVTLENDLSSDVTYLGATISNGSGSCILLNGITLSCDLNDLIPGAFVTVFIDVLVDPSVPHGTVLFNTATTSSTVSDSNPTNNSVTEDTTVSILEANLELLKTSDRDVYSTSDTIIYTIEVNNTGPSDALDVVMVDDLPLNPRKIEYFYDSGNGACAYDEASHTVTCNFGTLSNGDSISVDIYVKTKGNLGLITNVATVTTTSFDPDLSDNTDTKIVLVRGGGSLIIINRPE